jgi:hypothetical protein
MKEIQKSIYTARIVFSEEHQADGSYQQIPEGYLVYLKGPEGEENYLGKDGSFSGNVNSDQYAHRFESREEARDLAEYIFYSIYSPRYNVLEWASIWDTKTRDRKDDELAMERQNESEAA